MNLSIAKSIKVLLLYYSSPCNIIQLKVMKCKLHVTPEYSPKLSFGIYISPYNIGLRIRGKWPSQLIINIITK